MHKASDDSTQLFRARVRQRWGHLNDADVDLLCLRRAKALEVLGPMRYAKHVADAMGSIEWLRVLSAPLARATNAQRAP